MQVVSIISTKGGVGKTTTAANLGGFLADAGLRVLLLDFDIQPTLSSYYELAHRAAGGTYELLAFNEQRIEQLVSRTVIAGLDLVVSNDDRGELNTLLLHAADGRLRLRHLLPVLAPRYDLVLIDTQGARSVMLEMAVLASDVALSPVTPEILAARELRRGTMQLIEDIAPYRHLGIEPPPLQLLINRVHPVSSNARLIQQALRDLFQGQVGLRVLGTDVPAIEAYPRAATRGLPVHRVEYRQPSGRVAPAALETMRSLASELFPLWKEPLARVSGRPQHPHQPGSARHG
ncbi:chromosome partitioning protein [Pollutimonas nitritireducens]|uniref:Chromosome partitioning protein n=1 Tax=Pollutimonas nitritireducens TaxID=2045209 RepID=A0A2N4UCW8_9BURK|nr:ParA family protein [Pollutimonas nitritireducens]PLC52869.1 chromosome partitioning protein [Pollutimonas nitritireducens]